MSKLGLEGEEGYNLCGVFGETGGGLSYPRKEGPPSPLPLLLRWVSLLC